MALRYRSGHGSNRTITSSLEIGVPIWRARIVSIVNVRRCSGVMPAAPCGRRPYRSELYQIISDLIISSSGWRGAPALELAGSLRVAGRSEPEPVTVSRARAGVRLFEQSDVGTARPRPRCTVTAVA